MRILALTLLTTLTLGGATIATAADLDYGVLRGPDYEPAAPIIDWNGVYVGGHGGYTSAALGFRNTFQPLVAGALIATTAESQLNASTLLSPRSQRIDGTSYGAYAGFNYQFDETVVGVEADYTRFEKSGQSSDRVSRFATTSLGYLETVTLAGLSTTRIEDFGTVRARAGYNFGNFLPFVTGGVAIGRAQVTDAVAISNYGYDQAAYKANVAASATTTTATTTAGVTNVTTTSPGAQVNVGNFGYASFNASNPDSSRLPPPRVVTRASTKVVAGIALGAGLEYALTQNIILRGEYQYVLFNDFDGHKVNLNTVRGGAAVKF
ncbi:outer membrane protein [Methylobacterium gossipiicola]|uniref:Outer membrane protein beta-barrel domain-containing protein n=1 Tax=Methylobacterium gossipiicola TaxID=582675 RepID=A0A1I2W6A4_9HYPH|nr:outer membrane beta-barrel protein [Methylobacterium gossipiicola]SFG96893.1 Outer membrane protein beta-barrel domain-containing protein [Methylobacterium gossipiicola]